ncbi:MAG: PKD domain-containing protein [Candidatus Peregrinibacteria bacterium]
MHTSLKRHRLIIGIGVVLLSSITIAHAIEQDQPFIMESWTLAPGSVLEVLAISDSSSHQVAWSLTKADGAFVQADRGPLFRERFVEAGDFLLRGEVTQEDHTPVTTRTFAIHIVPGTPTSVEGNEGASLVVTDPRQDVSGNAVLDSNAKTILISAKPGSSALSIDLDGTLDTNGDGDPTNDNDTRGTFFETEGAPLRVWFTVGHIERTFTVRGNGAAGPATQVIQLYSGSIPPPVEPSVQTPVTSPNGLELVHIENHGSGTYAFAIEPSALSSEGRALLFYWDFGDGRQSMLDHPMHTYAQNNQYTVSLQVRDLATAQEVLRITGILPVDSIMQVQQSSSASVSSESSASTTSSRFNLRTILSIIGGLLLAIVAGFAVVTIIGKIVQRRLDKEPPTSGNASGKKSPTPAGPPSLDLAPPMPVIDAEHRQEIVDSPFTQHDKQPEEPEVEESATASKETSKLNELAFKEEEAPSWLKQGHDEAEKRGHTVATAAPAPTEPIEAPSAPSQPEEQKEQRSIPPWLSESPQEESEPATPSLEPVATPPQAPAEPTPQPEPVVPPPAASEPQTPPTPTPAPVSAPSPTPAPAPVTPPAPISPAPVPTPKIEKQEAAPAPIAEETEPDDMKEEEDTQKELTPVEREKRRKKRARYRANKKKREEIASQEEPSEEPKEQEVAPPPKTPDSDPTPAEQPEESDEPIAIIRADNISQDTKDEKGA